MRIPNLPLALALAMLASPVLAIATGGGGEAGVGVARPATVTGHPMSPETLQVLKSQVLNRIHHLNRAGIQLTDLAVRQAGSEQVRQLARSIRRAHLENEERVISLAKKENVTLEKFQPATHELSLLSGLQSLRGEQFDQAFVETVEQNHLAVTQELEMLSDRVRDPEVKRFITQLVPEIRQQHRMSRRFSMR